ncbi:MAG: hypothetical protein SGJ24_14430 [Chloroflexota bacterium]|nr:hypothetical protein [Chloroflexota bacterium]
MQDTPLQDAPAPIDPIDPIDLSDPTPATTEAPSRGSDPFFGYLIALALSIGLTPLIPLNADLRYALVWALLALFGVAGWLLGSAPRIEGETIENLAWGLVFGLLVGAPILLVGGSTLTTTARLMFTVGAPDGMLLPPGALLSFVVFTQPLAETLFFRGVMQHRRSFWLVGVMSSLWTLVLFLPMLEIGRFPVVAVIIGIALVLVNMIYSYVRQRNGLAAAWLCQIVVNVIMIVLPYFGS